MMAANKATKTHYTDSDHNLATADLCEIAFLAAALVAKLEPFMNGCAEDRDRLLVGCAPFIFQVYNLLHYLTLPKGKRDLLVPWVADLTHTVEARLRDPGCDLM